MNVRCLIPHFVDGKRRKIGDIFDIPYDIAMGLIVSKKVEEVKSEQL